MAKPEGKPVVEYHVNVENEQLVLAAMMTDHGAFRDLSNSISKDTFIGERHQVVFSILQDMNHRHLNFDIETFVQLGGTRNYGGRKYIEKLCEAFPNRPKNLEHHVERLRVDAVKFSIRTGVLQELMDVTEDPSTDLDRISGLVQGVTRQLSGHLSSGVHHGYALYERYLADIRARRKSASFVPTGYDWLDEDLIEGLARKKVSILTARPSIGKSTFAWNVADRVANTHGVKTVYFALEMDEISVLDGIVSARTEIPIDKIVKSPQELTKADLKTINDAVFKVTENGNLVFWEKGLTLEKVSRILSEDNYGLAIFDLFEKMVFKKEAGVISSMLDNAQQMAKDHDCHFMLVHQTRRGVEKRPNKRPTLEDLKNSGGYEEAADLVIALYREKYYNEEEPEDVMEVGILKQRRGVRLSWHYFEFEGAIGRVGKEVRHWQEKVKGFE